MDGGMLHWLAFFGNNPGNFQATIDLANFEQHRILEPIKAELGLTDKVFLASATPEDGARKRIGSLLLYPSCATGNSHERVKVQVGVVADGHAAVKQQGAVDGNRIRSVAVSRGELPLRGEDTAVEGRVVSQLRSGRAT